MMPPPHIGDNNKNRVENIKKKFEGSNKFVPISDNLNNVAAKSRAARQEDENNGNADSRCQTDTPKKQKLALTTDISASNSGGHFLNNQTPSKGHPVLERQLSSPTSRGHIKRSPAFRCDRIVRGKNVLAPSPGAPRSVVGKRVKQFDSTPDLVSAKICNVIGDEQPHQFQVKLSADGVNERARAFTSPDNLSRSPKDTLDSNSSGPCEAKRNRLDYQGGSTGGKNGLPINSPSSWLLSRGLGKPDILNDNKVKTPFSNQDSFPVKNLLSEIKLKRTVNGFNEEKTDASLKNHINQAGPAPKAVSLTVIPSNGNSQTYQQGLSATLKAALKAPLPCGPPPKKPPRTFAHNSPKVKSPSERLNNLKCNPGAIRSQESSCHISVSPPPVIKPVRSKTESQIMLRKLEDALMNHKPSPRGAQSPTSPVNKGIRQGSLSPPGNGATSGYPICSNSQNKICTPTHAARSGCLTSLNCAVGPTLCSQPRDSVYEVKAKQPEFIPDPHTKRKSSLQDNTSNVQKNIPGSLHKSHSVEHIYAEPFQFIGDGNQICKSKDCEANFRSTSFGREIPKPQPRFQPKRILSTSPEQILRTRLGSPTETNSEGLHYLCTPIQEDSPLSSCELQMSSLPLRLSPPPVEATNSELLKNAGRGCLSLEMPRVTTPSSSKMILKRSPAEKDKMAKDVMDTNLTSTKIKFLMNQAFGSPLQCLPATPLDSNSDSDSLASTPDEGVSCAPFPGIPSPPIQSHHKEITRPNCPPPDVPESASPTKESLQQLTAERQTYVRRVSSHVMGQRTLRLAHKTANTPSNHLFECLLLVGLNLDPDRPKCKVPYIKSKFPPEAIVPSHIENLCFPDAGEWPPPITSVKGASDSLPGEEQCYSLVVTSEVGERKYGYCRRVQPEGAPICLPLAYCILTQHRASGFYFKVLAELESRHGEPELLQAEFIQQLYDCGLPSPGQGLRVHGSGENISVGCAGSSSSSSSSGTNSSGTGSRGPVVLKRPYDTRLEERDLTRLFNCLQIPIFLQVFSSLLLERKVLLLSKSISKLSACVDALQSILFPFVWQHTFIPVLPANMLDICQAPTPYIIGVLKGKHPILPPVSIDDGIVVDVDNSLILQSQQDETTILPVGISRSLKVALQLAQSSTPPDDPLRNVLVSEAFLRTFVEVCGHYQTHIVVQQDGKKVFERESFIKAVRSRSIQLFLEWFTETAMFSAFIDSRVDKLNDTKGMFEQRVMEHHEEREKNTLLYLKNYKGINKKVKTLGDRFKDWAPFS
ncbi:DENN domain-containing protein 2A-like [Thrips palmi]|uniref:DENN domain-containing protein 2A-like n=1 Tax=Thrips palmi TaxID=161013 RepID=A0A6P8Y610_THRPL|nr:DENN domain-containing protein 2A-like [Thrips palmi]